MTQIIGTIKTDVGELDSLKVTYCEPGTTTLVGHVIDFGEELGLGKTYVVCSEDTFLGTSRALNAIIAKIISTQESKKITFLQALNIYLDSMDHFIRVRKSKNK